MPGEHILCYISSLCKSKWKSPKTHLLPKKTHNTVEWFSDKNVVVNDNHATFLFQNNQICKFYVACSM